MGNKNELNKSLSKESPQTGDKKETFFQRAIKGSERIEETTFNMLHEIINEDDEISDDYVLNCISKKAT